MKKIYLLIIACCLPLLYRSAVAATISPPATAGACTTSDLLSVTVSGNVFLDENYNGLRDAGEPGLAGANVIVRGPGGYTYNSITDVNGRFSFTGPEGFYQEIGVAPMASDGPFCWNGFGY